MKKPTDQPFNPRLKSLNVALRAIRDVEHEMIGLGLPDTLKRVGKLRSRITLHLEQELIDSGQEITKINS